MLCWIRRFRLFKLWEDHRPEFGVPLASVGFQLQDHSLRLLLLLRLKYHGKSHQPHLNIVLPNTDLLLILNICIQWHIFG